MCLRGVSVLRVVIGVCVVRVVRVACDGHGAVVVVVCLYALQLGYVIRGLYVLY